MKFGELKTIINRNPGRHEWVAINIGLGTDAIVKSESPMLDLIDDYEVAWICPSTIGENLVTDKEQPCIEVHLKEKKNPAEESVTDGKKVKTCGRCTEYEAENHRGRGTSRRPETEQDPVGGPY